MSSKIAISQKKYQPSNMQEALLDFTLSRQAMLCTPRTLKFYRDTLNKFIEWLDQSDINDPEDIDVLWATGIACLAGKADPYCS